MSDSTATDEVLRWEMEHSKAKATASRANLLQLRSFFLVLAVTALTITIATWLAGQGRLGVLR